MLPDLSKYPKLTDAQAGHLRHFHNLSAQLDGQWNHMGAQEPMQEFLDALRYQLSTMAYAVGLSHYHRLPALRSTHKTLLRRLIRKMLRREVWGYWFNTSLSGNRTDPGRKELRTPWADPVVRENIMYSGHLLLMTSLYAMLFDDDEFERPGSLVFRWDPLFFGLGPETFSYDNGGLQRAIVDEMESNGWVGVCCEPNLVFVVCNQFPIIAMRYNDVRHGTNVTATVLEKYQKAWKEMGMVAHNGLYYDWYFLRQGVLQEPTDVSFTAWANAFMNTWNPGLVHSLYERQAQGFITSIDGQVRLHDAHVAAEYRAIIQAGGQHSSETLSRARADAARPSSSSPLTRPTFGYVVQWLSELGKARELDGLLDYADAHLRPTWDKGGLFYPRHDGRTDEAGGWTHMDPFSGNAAVGYARLNVADGQRTMWERPWTRELLEERPWIDGVDLAQGVDCLRGVWDEGEGVLLLTMRAWHGEEVEVTVVARNLNRGVWQVYVDERLVAEETVEGGHMSVPVRVRGDDMDVVFLLRA